MAATHQRPVELNEATDDSQSDCILLTKAIGLKDENGVELFDIETPPFANARTKAHWKPNRKHMNDEVIRRYQSIDGKPVARAPGSNWSLKKCTQYLLDNPIVDEEEIRAIREDVAAFKVLLQEAAERRPPQQQWKGDFIYLRLIHCLIEDDIRLAYQRSFNTMTRPELDARHSSVSPISVFELIANKMNDVLYSPSTRVYENLHSNYRTSITLSHESMGIVGTIVPDKVKEKIADMRVKLTRIIADWTRSGEGDGGRSIDSTADFGDASEIARGENDNRKSFLRSDAPYILYLWQASWDVDLLPVIVQRMHPSVAAASAQNIQSVYPPPRKRRAVTPVNESNELKEVISSLKNSTEVARIEKRHAGLKVLMKEERETRLAITRAKDPEEKAALQQILTELQDEIKSETNAYDAMVNSHNA